MTCGRAESYRRQHPGDFGEPQDFPYTGSIQRAEDKLPSMVTIRTLMATVALLLASPAAAQDLIYLTHPEGQKLFGASRYQSSYFAVASYLETEHVRTFCGPASIAAVMNSLDVERPKPRRLYPYGLFTQDEVFTAENQRVKSYDAVEREGLTLEEVRQFVENLGVRAIAHHGDSFDPAWLRQAIKRALGDPGRRLIVNYWRPSVGQEGGGHFSPVGAYDEATDRVLVLDVAKYKYPPAWVPLVTLYEAMKTIDPASRQARGLVMITR